eukprot:TRINITY_DN12463_c0_g1_i1.p1 TRINITY_DN12463_c0_g1~~TRINITY_DN12463_c0_g1_i1.p1  ORF type:complete len:560 (-),score=76.83 TRINITY_DN12463_c0_g1_i1:119-1549(-)
MVVPFLILFCDFYIYAEDPVQDSHVVYVFPVFGHIYNLFFGLFAGCSGGYVLWFFRLALVVVSLAIGAYFSNQWIHHKFLRDTCKLSMFSENKGELFIMSLVLPLFLTLASLIFNLFAPSQCLITSDTALTYSAWGKIFQVWSAFLDIVSIIMIWDAVLQDSNVYKTWFRRGKVFWREKCGGWFRVVFAWLAIAISLSLLIYGVSYVGHGEGDYSWRHMGANIHEITLIFAGWSQIGRTIFLNLVIFFDLLTVAQDWDFPTFKEPVDVNIAGTFSTELHCGCLERLYKGFHFKITGPWLTYGPLLFVLIADLTCARTQYVYQPQNFGQYVDIREEYLGRVWTIVDQEYLRRAYDHGVLQNRSLITYAARRDLMTGLPLDNSSATDVMLQTKYKELPYLPALALPGVMLILCFSTMVLASEDSLKSLEAVAEDALESFEAVAASVTRRNPAYLACWRKNCLGTKFATKGQHEAMVLS